ncbi:MAG: hypothetical protein HY080_16780 [Gammaproteobacteria bacterium]|nr:hypothetical protein [Gammaproteobacteria bacterium]
MKKLLTAILGITGTALLPNWVHADSFSLSFSTRSPAYITPITTYEYTEHYVQPQVIVVHDEDDEDEDHHHRYYNHGHGYHYDRYDHYRPHYDGGRDRYGRCGQADRGRYEHHGDRYPRHGAAYNSGSEIRRIETNPRIFR